MPLPFITFFLSLLLCFRSNSFHLISTIAVVSFLQSVPVLPEYFSNAENESFLCSLLKDFIILCRR